MWWCNSLYAALSPPFPCVQHWPLYFWSQVLCSLPVESIGGSCSGREAGRGICPPPHLCNHLLKEVLFCGLFEGLYLLVEILENSGDKKNNNNNNWWNPPQLAGSGESEFLTSSYFPCGSIRLSAIASETGEWVAGLAAVTEAKWEGIYVASGLFVLGVRGLFTFGRARC